MSEYPFAIRQRVRFAETDALGVVYHANYLVYAEVGRSAFLKFIGLDRERDLTSQGFDIAIGEASLRFRAPLRFDEEFDVRVRVGDVRRSTWAFEYRVDRADGLHCADVSTTQVLIDRSTGRAARVPAPVRLLLLAAGGRSAAR